MSKYKAIPSASFLKDMKKIKSDFNLQKRLDKKLLEIFKNPYPYKSLRNVLKNKKRVHIGSFVLTFEINEAEKKVLLDRFTHHDKAYK